MIKLEEIAIPYGARRRRIGLYRGDLANMPREESVDVLVVSAFKDDYTPTHGSVIGSLHEVGLSLRDLPVEKDMRASMSCWLSSEIAPPRPAFPFKRILVFEPAWRGSPPEVVTDIFQSLAATLLIGSNEMSVAMPLVASGDMMWPASEMLTPLLQAAMVWMRRGLPLRSLKIVEKNEAKAEALRLEFKAFKAALESAPTPPKPAVRHDYDAVISYAHVDGSHAEVLAAELKRARPDLRVFVDRESIEVGALWLERLFDAIEACDKVVALLSPAYLESRYCKQEFMATMNREHKKNERVLFPLYLLTVEYMPAPFDLYQFVDCREADPSLLQVASQRLLEALAD